jgi:cellulose synthase/poly-beta-1,6-N-acetylglucosamine synthase-like glycosyltransferase
MARNFTDSIGIVQGPKKITGPDGLITRYQKLEVFGLVSIEAASFALGNPLLASAPSLAYRKSLYENAGGFSGMEHLVSGDDDMLVHKMANLPGGNVRYNLDIQACVSTAPARDWLSLLRQRARWASNGTHYQSKPYICLLISIFAFYLWLFVSPLLALTGALSWGYFLLPFTVKVSLEYLFLLQTSRKFRQHKILRDIWWSEFVHVPMTLAAAVMGFMGWYRWK